MYQKKSDTVVHFKKYVSSHTVLHFLKKEGTRIFTLYMFVYQ